MTLRRLARTVTLVGAVTVAGIVLSTPARAEDWKYSFAPYFWAADISLDHKINGDPVLAADVDFSDLLDKLELAFLGHLEMSTDKGGFFADAIWMSLTSADERSGGGLLDGTEIRTDLAMGVYEFGAFYHPTKPGTGFDLIFGVRAIDIDQDIQIELPNDEDHVRSETEETLTDAFVGIRAGGPIGGGFDLMIRGDVGTGDTDLTWNAIGSIGYRFGSKDQFDVRAGWKQMSIHLEDAGTETTTESDITMKGPIVGFNWTF